MRCLTYLMVSFGLSNLAKGQFETFLDSDPDTLTDHNTVVEKWGIMESRIRNLSEEVVSMIFPTLSEMMITLNISRSCFRDCTKLFLGLRKLNTWAVKFLDATTKSADGILNLQSPSLGSYDECVENKVYFGHHVKGKRKVMFQGKYCSVNIRPYISRNKILNIMPESVNTGFLKDAYPEESVFSEIEKLASLTYVASIKAGVCVPSGCSTDDVNKILRKASDYLGLSMKTKRCEIKEKKEFTPGVVAVMTVYCFVGFLMLLGTTIETYCHYSGKAFENTCIRILKAFSLISNFKKLTNITSSSNTDCLHGIRFLSLSWIVLAHTTMISLATNPSMPRNYADYIRDIAFQVLLNSNPSVETFFFLSGFLVCYVTTKLVKIQKKSFKMGFYLLHRLFRLIPAYSFVIGYELLKPLTGSGPKFHEIHVPFTKFCEKNWWTNLLFINNFYNQNEMCLPHSWFIAADLQLYCFAPVIMLPLMRWPKIGVCIAAVIIVGCTLATAVISYTQDILTMLFLVVSSESFTHFHNYYNMTPYLHATPYCTGLLLGYLLATRSDIKVPKVLQVLGWSASTAMCLAVVYGVQKWNTGVPPTLWEKTIYSALSKPAWSLGIAWMIFCCCTGRGGVVNYILSWKMWVPLSRLTYFAYLVHIAVIMSYFANMRAVLFLDNYVVVWIFLGNLLITYAVAFVGSILIESPVLSLEKMFLYRGGQKEALSSVKGFELEAKDLEKNGVVKDNTSKNGSDNNTGSQNEDFTQVSTKKQDNTL